MPRPTSSGGLRNEEPVGQWASEGISLQRIRLQSTVKEGNKVGNAHVERLGSRDCERGGKDGRQQDRRVRLAGMLLKKPRDIRTDFDEIRSGDLGVYVVVLEICGA